MIYFTADYHFNHNNIIKYCNRPFSTVSEMNEVIISRYNECVNENDLVYILGDISLSRNIGQISNYIFKLKGKKILILGNHDYLKPLHYLDYCGFESVHTNLTIETHVGKFNLIHDPKYAKIKVNEWFIVGHIHEKFKFQENTINVGVDVWNFYPVTLDQIANIIHKK